MQAAADPAKCDRISVELGGDRVCGGAADEDIIDATIAIAVGSIASSSSAASIHPDTFSGHSADRIPNVWSGWLASAVIGAQLLQESGELR